MSACFQVSSRRHKGHVQWFKVCLEEWWQEKVLIIIIKKGEDLDLKDIFAGKKQVHDYKRFPGGENCVLNRWTLLPIWVWAFLCYISFNSFINLWTLASQKTIFSVNCCKFLVILCKRKTTKTNVRKIKTKTFKRKCRSAVWDARLQLHSCTCTLAGADLCSHSIKIEDMETFTVHFQQVVLLINWWTQWTNSGCFCWPALLR